MDFSEEDYELIQRALAHYIPAVLQQEDKAIGLVEDSEPEDLALALKEEVDRGRNIFQKIMRLWMPGL